MIPGYSDQVFCILKDFKQRCWMFLVLFYCNSKTFLESSVYFKKKKKIPAVILFSIRSHPIIYVQ